MNYSWRCKYCGKTFMSDDRGRVQLDSGEHRDKGCTFVEHIVKSKAGRDLVVLRRPDLVSVA